MRIDSAHDADDTLATGFALDDEMRASLEGGALDFIVKRNARHEDERMWIEQANGECGEPAYSYNDADNGRVDVFRGVVSHLRTRSTADRPLFCVWEVKRMKRGDELFARYSTATSIYGSDETAIGTKPLKRCSGDCLPDSRTPSLH